MNRFKWLATATLLALGCGDVPEDFEDDAEDIGTLQQALTVPSGFGEFQGSPSEARCLGTWSSPKWCSLPSDRTFRFRDDLPDVQPFNRDYRGAFQAALNCIKQDAGSNWTFQMGDNMGDSQENVSFGTGDPSLAWASDFPFTPSVFTHNGLRYGKHNRCSITFNDDAIAAVQYANPSSPLTAAQMKAFITNVARSELCHCVELGHNTGSGICRPTVNPNTYFVQPSCGTTGQVGPQMTTTERNLLRAYVP